MSPPHFDIGGFFVLRKFRRRGGGAQVAQRLFTMFPGRWTVGSMVGNKPANAFWWAVVAELTGNSLETTEEKDPLGRSNMIVHHFRSNGASDQTSDGTA
jgi:predicted acetyltransferase